MRDGFAHLGAEFLGEISVGIGIVAGRRRRAGTPRRRCRRSGRVALALQFLVQALADHGPIAQVVGDAPDQLDDAGAEFGDLARGGGQEVFGGLAGFAGQHQQELAAAARAEQNAGQSQFRQQRARQHFAQQSDPLRTSGQQIFAGGARRRPSAEPAKRNSSVPRILPCSRICSDIEAEKP